jgi:hypothetical protein
LRPVGWEESLQKRGKQPYLQRYIIYYYKSQWKPNGNTGAPLVGPTEFPTEKRKPKQASMQRQSIEVKCTNLCKALESVRSQFQVFYFPVGHLG